ncbi:Uncharacterised protein [Bordetella pertussis]|nr:Uncharacterised protein [Bordetella pertussis]
MLRLVPALAALAAVLLAADRHIVTRRGARWRM